MGFIDFQQLGVTERPQKYGFIKSRAATDDDNIAKMLNEPDPETGLPRDPVAIYSAADTSPEVKAYIERVYLSRQNNALGATQSNDVSDDILFENIPDHNSTLNEFEEKVAKRLQEEKQKADDERFLKKYRNFRKKENDN